MQRPGPEGPWDTFSSLPPSLSTAPALAQAGRCSGLVWGGPHCGSLAALPAAHCPSSCTDWQEQCGLAWGGPQCGFSKPLARCPSSCICWQVQWPGLVWFSSLLACCPLPQFLHRLAGAVAWPGETHSVGSLAPLPTAHCLSTAPVLARLAGAVAWPREASLAALPMSKALCGSQPRPECPSWPLAPRAPFIDL